MGPWTLLALPWPWASVTPLALSPGVDGARGGIGGVAPLGSSPPTSVRTCPHLIAIISTATSPPGVISSGSAWDRLRLGLARLQHRQGEPLGKGGGRS